MQALSELLRRDDSTPRRVPVYIANLFFSLHYAAIIYVNSTLLSGYFTDTVISALYVVGALANVILFLNAPRIINAIGNRALFIILIVLSTIAAAGLGLADTALGVGFFFLVYEAVSIMIYYCLDIFLEAASKDNITGDIRGIDLTLANAAFLFGPILVAIYAIEGNFLLLYLAASLVLLPVLWMGVFSFKTYREEYDLPHHHILPIRAWAQSRNVKGISLSRLSLEFYFSLMTIYIPLYLHGHLGFSWQEIGIMFTIMLLPFVMFQLPAGDIADKKLGEKEILTLGFFILGVPLLVMPFVDKNFLWWTILLFVSRIGAALIEVMTDTYFFKRIDSRDKGLISIYRLMRPLSIVIAAAVGAAALILSSFNALFFIMAISTIWGMFEGLRIVDTK